jgi:hypothetical protein
MRKRFYRGLGGYAALAVLAWFTLDGDWRLGVLVILGALLAKSWIDLKKSEIDG